MAPAGVATEQEAGHGGAGAAEWRVDVQAAAGGEHENAKGGGQQHRAWMAAAWPWGWEWAAGLCKAVWKVGADDPRRVVHGFKVALALTLCSLFYYVRPLYLFAGENNAMWAILTVVVVFEYTVGGCLYKGLNRAMATVAGGGIALGVHWVAGKAGKEVEPYLLTGSLFFMAAVATFSRFIPTMKAKFDYGVTIFILTYCLVSVSGYRAKEVALMAQQRLTTVAIGALICFAVCTLVFPVWAGQELHALAARNLEKLAAAVEGCVEDYFFDYDRPAAADGNDDGGKPAARRCLSEKSHAYKLVLNGKASEDSLANLAKWEPGHGKFGFRHPYGQYQKIGTAMRCCAYCIDALAACVGSESEAQTPAHVRRHLAGTCLALSRNFAAVLREAAGCVTSMTRSERLALVVADMNAAAQELRDELRCLATILEEEDDDGEPAETDQPRAIPTPPLIQALPLFSAASLLLEVCARAERVVGSVETLATAARFKKADHHGEKTTTTPLDNEAAMAMTGDPIDAHDVSQETTHAKISGGQERIEKANASCSSDHGRGDQVGQLMKKVLMRRRSIKKKWSRGDRDAKVTPKTPPLPPLDFTIHVPSPRHRALELVGHRPVASASPSNAAPLTPSPRNRSMEFANHGPVVVPSPRNRSMDFANHGSVVVPSPRNRSMEFAAHTPSPLMNRSILGMA